MDARAKSETRFSHGQIAHRGGGGGGTCAKQKPMKHNWGTKKLSASPKHSSVLLIYDWPVTVSVESREDAESCDGEDGAETDSELRLGKK